MKHFRIYCLFLISALLGLSQHSPRDFMARWSYSSPLHQGTHVNVRISLRLWNMGLHDLTGGVIEIREHRDMDKRIEAFRAVDVEEGSSKMFRGFIDVSQEEFQFWERGAEPDLALSFRDPDGNMRRLPVDVSRALGGDNEK